VTKHKSELPFTGYEIERIYTPHQLLEHKDPGEPATHGVLDIGWDWRLVLDADAPTFEVRLTATIEPSEERDDLIAASVVGRFRQAVEAPVVPLLDFVRLQGPAILLPYVRQVLSSLTSVSYYGSYYLPPVNVQSLMADFDPDKTFGAKQLAALAAKHRENPESTQGPASDPVAARPPKKTSRKRTGPRLPPA
jgi:preprotein translocase subunit SecB